MGEARVMRVVRSRVGMRAGVRVCDGSVRDTPFPQQTEDRPNILDDTYVLHYEYKG